MEILFGILFIILIIVFILFILKKEEFVNYYYKKKVFTRSELLFFIQLKKYLEEYDLNIFTKVRLADFVGIDKKLNYKQKTGLLNKINRKHIDFLIVDNEGNIKLLIELDDRYHKREKVIKNDIFKNNLFENIEIKLIRFNVSKNYKFDIIEEFLQ